MFSPIVFDFGELYSIFIASIVGVHITLSDNVQRMIKLAININLIQKGVLVQLLSI